MEKEILERANKGETSQICGSIGAGLGRVDQKGVTVTSGQSSYVGRGGSLQTPGKFSEEYNLFLNRAKVSKLQ